MYTHALSISAGASRRAPLQRGPVVYLERRNRAIQRLTALACLTRGAGSCATDARIEFLEVAFAHDLVPELRANQLHTSETPIGECDFDACLEGEDAEVVIHRLIVRALMYDGLAESIRIAMGDDTFDQWAAVHLAVEAGAPSQHLLF